MGTSRIYLRQNGSFGANYTDPECNLQQLDTGHTIHEDSGKFTVWSIQDGSEICNLVSREDAEKKIAEDWRQG